MSSAESGSYSAIYKVYMEVPDLITLNIEEFDIYHFGKELQN